MTSWVTYARPFARRRRIYRTKAWQRQECYSRYPTGDPVELEFRDGRVETAQTCAEAIEIMWAEFVRAALQKDTTT